jgi:ADP-heptose:LPS heptosyltransferase
MTVGSLWVIRLSALGDVVLCEPAVAALAERYPGARITVVTRPPYADLFRRHPAVDAVVDPDEARSLARPDLAVDLQNRLGTRWLALRARTRRHWRKRDAAGLWRALRGRPLHTGYREGPHQLERIARALALPPLRPPRVHLDEAWIREAAALAPDGPPWVALCPGAAHAVKTWPAERFLEVGRALAAAGARPLVCGGPAEAALLADLADALGAPRLPPDLRLGVVAALLARTRVAVANDSGLGHLAAAVGTPVVSVFGPTPPGRWAPPHAFVVTLDPACGPCSDHGARPCTQPRRFCLDDLAAAPVVAALLSLLHDTRQSLRG